jgi:hypothetical protein
MQFYKSDFNHVTVYESRLLNIIIMQVVLFTRVLYPARILVTAIVPTGKILMPCKCLSFRYIAVCFPLAHRDMSYTYSVERRVVAYAVPVVVLAVVVNLPKFLETKVVTEIRLDDVDGTNVTTYTIDVTDLR